MFMAAARRPFPPVVSVILFLVAILADGSAKAGEAVPAEVMDFGGLFLPAGAEGRVRAAPLLGTDIQVSVSGVVARTRVTQTFRNPGQAWTEAVYTYPLPPDSAVDRLRMTVGGRVTEGHIEERARARRTYTAAKTAGRRATLVEQQRPNIFTTAIANLGPAEEVAVTIEFQERLDFRDGQFALSLPLVVGPRYIPGQAAAVNFTGNGWSAGTDQMPDAGRITPPLRSEAEGAGNPVTLALDLAAGFPIGKLESPTHDIKIRRETDDHARVTLAGDAVPADRDFVLRWAPAAGTAPQAGFFWEKVAGDNYGLLLMMPPITGGAGLPRMPKPDRDVTFVIDTSGSMHGTSLDQAKAALSLALDRLGPQDRFRVIAFSHANKMFSPVPLSATPENRARAKGFVQVLEAQGGTEIVPAMDAALDRSGPVTEDNVGPRLGQVVLITDGAVGNEDQLFGLIHAKLGAARLFTVGIGSAPNGFLMSRAARAGRGTYTYIHSPAEVGERMAELFLKLERPALTDVSLSWDGAPSPDRAAEVWPDPLPDLYAGEPVAALLKLNGAGPEVRVSGRIGGRLWSQTLTIGGGAPSPGVAALWGRAKIRQLTDDMRRAPDRDALRARIVETALKLNLVSAHTSLVAVDLTPARPAGEELRNSQVPTNLPAGWTREHLEGARDTNVPQKAESVPAAPTAGLHRISFNPDDPALAGRLGKGFGTPLSALPKTATPAPAFMILGLLFLLAALVLLLLGWRRPDADVD